MKLNAVLTAFASKPRRLTNISLLLLVGVLVLYCAGNSVSALDGYTISSWGTTTDTTGLDIGPSSARTCFLSGITGNLSLGAQPGFGCATRAEPSTAQVKIGQFPQGHYRLIAHGGACENQADQKVWQNNPVNAQATCVSSTTGVINGHWRSDEPNPRKIAELHTSLSGTRQCFLSSVVGVAGAWNNNGRRAAVHKITTPSPTFPTTGWYIDSNVPTAGDNSHATISARCVNFPLSTKITTGITPISQMTITHTLTSGGGIKACGLTGIMGAFKVNSWHDGIIMNAPANIDGNWTLTVSPNKMAFWACVK